jgi:hypothetical protein
MGNRNDHWKKKMKLFVEFEFLSDSVPREIQERIYFLEFVGWDGVSMVIDLDGKLLLCIFSIDFLSRVQYDIEVNCPGI